MEVLNEIGHGLREKTYERALCVEFNRQGLECASQHVYPVYYKGEKVNDYIPDLEVEGKLVVETKVVEKITGMEVELILNFKHSKLEWKKVVLKSGR